MTPPAGDLGAVDGATGSVQIIERAQEPPSEDWLMMSGAPPGQDASMGQEPKGGRRRGRPPMSDGVDTRNRILSVARQVFSELGYEKTTFKEIAERAGLTRPAVNHYFHNKEALYTALFDATRDSVVQAALAQAAGEDKLPNQLSMFLHAAAQIDSTDRTFARFIAASLLDAFRHPELRDRAQNQLEDVRAFVDQALNMAIERGEIRADTNVSAVTEMLIAVMWGMGLYAGFVGTHEQLESVVEQFSRLLEGNLWVS